MDIWLLPFFNFDFCSPSVESNVTIRNVEKVVARS
jgi:hypothetical protein